MRAAEKVKSKYACFVFVAGAGVSSVKSNVAVAAASFTAPLLGFFAGRGVLEHRATGGGLEDMRQMTSGISGVVLSKIS